MRGRVEAVAFLREPESHEGKPVSSCCFLTRNLSFCQKAPAAGRGLDAAVRLHPLRRRCELRWPLRGLGAGHAAWAGPPAPGGLRVPPSISACRGGVPVGARADLGLVHPRRRGRDLGERTLRGKGEYSTGRGSVSATGWVLSTQSQDSHLRTAPRLKTHYPVQAQDSRLKTRATGY